MEHVMPSQALWPDSDIGELARANRSDAAPDANGIPPSRDFYEAARQRAQRDRAVFSRSMFTRLFWRP
jgi:hypothetical protein